MRQTITQAMFWGSDSKAGGPPDGQQSEGWNSQEGFRWGEAKKILEAVGSWASDFNRYKYIKNKATGHSKQIE